MTIHRGETGFHNENEPVAVFLRGEAPCARRGAGSTGHDDDGRAGAWRRHSSRLADRRGTLALPGRGFGPGIGA